MLIRFRLKCRFIVGDPARCLNVLSIIVIYRWFPSAPQTHKHSSNSIIPLAEDAADFAHRLKAASTYSKGCVALQRLRPEAVKAMRRRGI